MALALCALALQLTLSFAHIHAEDFAPALQSSVPAPDHAPDNDSPAHHDCAICATIHLAGSLVLSPPPAMAMPVEVAPDRPPVAGRHDLAGARGDFFRARDPPPHA